MTRVGRCIATTSTRSFIGMSNGSLTAGSPALNGALGMALDALRDELGLTIRDLAERTPYDDTALSMTLLGKVPATDGHLPSMARALADVIEYQTLAASHV